MAELTAVRLPLAMPTSAEVGHPRAMNSFCRLMAAWVGGSRRLADFLAIAARVPRLSSERSHNGRLLEREKDRPESVRDRPGGRAQSANSGRSNCDGPQLVMPGARIRGCLSFACGVSVLTALLPAALLPSKITHAPLLRGKGVPSSNECRTDSDAHAACPR